MALITPASGRIKTVNAAAPISPFNVASTWAAAKSWWNSNSKDHVLSPAIADRVLSPIAVSSPGSTPMFKVADFTSFDRSTALTVTKAFFHTKVAILFSPISLLLYHHTGYANLMIQRIEFSNSNLTFSQSQNRMSQLPQLSIAFGIFLFHAG